MPAGRMRVAGDREPPDDPVARLRDEHGRVGGAADRAQVAPLVADAAPLAVRDQPALGLGADRLRERDQRGRVAGVAVAHVDVHSTTTAGPAAPRIAGGLELAVLADRHGRDAAEEDVARRPAHDVVAAPLELVQRGGVDALLHVQQLVLQVDARRGDRLLHSLAVVDHVHDVCMIALRSRAEPALPTTRRGSPPRRTSEGAIMLASRRPGRRRRRERLQIALAEHVVHVDPGPGDDDARAGARGRRERRDVPLRVDDAHMGRGRKAERLGRGGPARAGALGGGLDGRGSRAAARRARRGRDRATNDPPRARVDSRITSARRAICAALPGASAARARSRTRRANAIRTPPAEDGGHVRNSVSRNAARIGLRRTTRYAARSSAVSRPPPSRTQSRAAPARARRGRTRRRRRAPGSRAWSRGRSDRAAAPAPSGRVPAVDPLALRLPAQDRIEQRVKPCLRVRRPGRPRARPRSPARRARAHGRRPSRRCPSASPGDDSRARRTRARRRSTG